jgi:hypothetical protein
MSKSLISKVIAIGATHLIFNVTMFFTGKPVASAAAISQALKWLSFGTHEQYGVCTLISIAFMVNSFLKRIL